MSCPAGLTHDAAEAKRCRACDRLWREYRRAAHSYASAIRTRYQLPDGSPATGAAIEALRAADDMWSETRGALLAHTSVIHEGAVSDAPPR